MFLQTLGSVRLDKVQCTVLKTWSRVCKMAASEIRNSGNSVNCTACTWTMLEFCAMCNSRAELFSFLVCHHVVLGYCWCECCGELCQIDFTRSSFRCDRRHVRRDSRGRRRTWRCNASVRDVRDIMTPSVQGMLSFFGVR